MLERLACVLFLASVAYGWFKIIRGCTLFLGKNPDVKAKVASGIINVIARILK